MRLPRRFATLLTSMLLACIALFFCVRAVAVEPSRTEVIVVGTVHQETTNYRAKDLVTILERVRPDCILCEYDASFFTKDYHLAFRFGGLEESAVREYLTRHSAELRPYDIDGRNDYYRKHRTFEREDAFFQAIWKARDAGELDSCAKEILETVMKGFAERDRFLASDPRAINSFTCDAALVQKAYVYPMGYAELSRRCSRLNAFREDWDEETRFEIRRNEAMIGHICDWAKQFPGKRLGVLCGFEHRHQLRSGIRFSTPSEILLKEYWDYPEGASTAPSKSSK